MYGGQSYGGVAYGDISSEASAGTPIFEDSWHQPWPIPNRARLNAARRRAQLASSEIVVDPAALTRPEASFADRWFVQVQTPLRFARRIKTGQQQFAAFVQFAPFAETVTADRWVPPLQQPLRFRPTLRADQRQYLAFYENPVTDERDRWMPPLQQPLRFAPRIRTGQQQYQAFVQFAPFSEAVHLEAWNPPLQQPLRFRRSIRVDQQQFFIHTPRPIALTSETITVTINMTITALPTSAYDQMLSDPDALFAYSAVISPWLLSDRGS